MSPEQRTKKGSFMMEEAEKIEPVLLKKQAETEAVAHQMETGGLRTKLGYNSAEPVDKSDIVDTRIKDRVLVVSPESLAEVLPLSSQSAKTTRTSRKNNMKILRGEDDRLLVVVGPCSIHDPEAALEYANFLQKRRQEYGNELEIVMRTYMEKPRTELGWKGFIYDPELDGSDRINLGLIAARMLACQITHRGVPIATERLNANTPQYFNGLITYDAIGARTTTDQKAREYASGTSSIVGFKNTPEGSVKAAAEAIKAANAPHSFLGMNASGLPIQVRTAGNESAHIILRGDQGGPNYSTEHIAAAKRLLHDKKLLEAIVIDASHGNSGKDYTRQIEVIKSVCDQLLLGETAIKGVMIESNLMAGKQDITPGQLEYGQSVTDACIGLEETNRILEILSQAVLKRRTSRAN